MTCPMSLIHTKDRASGISSAPPSCIFPGDRGDPEEMSYVEFPTTHFGQKIWDLVLGVLPFRFFFQGKEQSWGILNYHSCTSHSEKYHFRNQDKMSTAANYAPFSLTPIASSRVPTAKSKQLIHCIWVQILGTRHTLQNKPNPFALLIQSECHMTSWAFIVTSLPSPITKEGVLAFYGQFYKEGWMIPATYGYVEKLNIHGPQNLNKYNGQKAELWIIIWIFSSQLYHHSQA